MFFEKAEKVTIDGTTYEISNGAMVDMWNCKSALIDIYNFLQPDMMEQNRDMNTYTSWKKELIKLLKEWDKVYVKHIKATYPEMSGYHANAMKPLTLLIEANLNFHKLNLMIESPTEVVPEFRFKALEVEFCKYFTGVCDILKEFGTLNNPYDIKQMLHVLKIEHWEKVRPFEFYMTPLKQAITKVRSSLLEMNRLGHLRIKYVIEKNEELAKEFLGLSVDFIKSTINSNKREFEQFDAWVETLGENVENQYELLDNMVFAKTADDFTKLVESRKQMWKLMSDTKEESTLTESINIPLESMFGVAADTFAKEYSQLSESELFELKSILRMSQDELNEGIERLKTEVLGKLSIVTESDEDTNNKLSETKQRIESTQIDSISYYKLKKLSEGL